jgi:hypothetical protein
LKVGLTATALAALVLTAGAASAQNFSIGAQAGTTGLGVEARYKLSDRFVLRGALDTFKYDVDVEGDDIDYDGEIDFGTAGAFVDYHPGGGSFFLSAGAYLGKREISISGRGQPGTTVEVGDEVYDADDVGTITGTADFGDLAPFLGLGWNTSFTSDGAIGFKFLVGAAFGDDADVRLARSGGVASPEIDAELAREEQELQDEVDGVGIYPVVQIGVSYRF